MAATAYDACKTCTGKSKGHPAFGITRSGLPAEPNRTIAVDPEVIPLGTWVYVDNLGLFRAEDTGGEIKGNRIDIFMPSHEEAQQFGVRPVTIWILKETF